MSGPVVYNTFEDCREIGDDVGSQIMQVINLSESWSALSLSNSNEAMQGMLENVKIPFEDPDKAEFFADFAEISTTEDQPFVSTVVQVIRIGDLGIVGLPGEIFSEIGINIKHIWHFPNIMVVGYTNDYIGYVGPPNVYEVGGYELLMMSFSPEEGPILEKTAEDLLNQLQKS
jgi:hypothetical protein